ncbi:MAG: UDP-N-acetylglucosamine 2-epimerase (non-hydrolyzing) [Verrucomicrobiota bacterium]
MKKKVIVIVGTRPEVIKMAPVYLALKDSEQLEPVLLATAQHREILDQALSVFAIQPDCDLDLMFKGQTLPSLTAKIINSVSDFLGEEPAEALLVQGDTTTVLGSALAAFYAGVPIGHVEAGLRTHNIHTPFPEEMNRRLTSPLCRWNFAPTELSKKNLIKEGCSEENIYVTGNTVIDALSQVRDRMTASSNSTEELFIDLEIPDSFRPFWKGRWILMTGHRRESFGQGFEDLCHAVDRITRRFDDVGILYPVHLNPNVRKPVNRILGDNKQVCLIEPVTYDNFVRLMDRATLILSDSGGIQEEAPSLGKPVLVTRESTERPEGVEAGTCRLVGTNPERIVNEVSLLLESEEELARRSRLANPYGDGSAAMRIRQCLESSLS